MAEILRGWWPVDKVIVGYLAAAGLLIAVFRHTVPGAGWLLGLHASGVAVLLAAMRSQSKASWIFRHWYPLPYVAACYREMSLLIPAIRGVDYDRQMAALDYWIWRANPTVWLERLNRPWATEILQILYALFVPAVLWIAYLFWRRRRWAEFRYYAFLIALGFLVSYAGYFAVPVRGPRFLLAAVQHVPLRGYAVFDALRTVLDRLESAHYDCFPSGHVELTALAWWQSRRLSPGLFRVYLLYTASIIFATVYLRYHYTVDVIAGVLVAGGLLAAAPHLYDRLVQRGR